MEAEDEFTGETRLELNGTANTIEVINYDEKGVNTTKTMNWPKNGLIYVKAESCGWPTSTSSEAYNADGTTEAEARKGLRDGVRARDLQQIADDCRGEDDLIINGSVYPTSVAGKLGSAPTGTATLGLIAGNYVRVYHPVAAAARTSEAQCTDSNLEQSEDPNGWGSQSNIWIYAAILSTDHSFLVDNSRLRLGARRTERVRRDRAELPRDRGDVLREHRSRATSRTTTTTAASRSTSRPTSSRR